MRFPLTAHWVGNGADTLMRRMLKTVAGDFTEEQVAQLRSVYDRAYEADPMHLVTEYPGIRAVLRTLKEQGIHIAVFSNKPDDMTCKVAELLYPGLFPRGARPAPRNPSQACPGRCAAAGKNAGSQTGRVPVYWRHLGGYGETGKNAGMETVVCCGASVTVRSWKLPEPVTSSQNRKNFSHW